MTAANALQRSLDRLGRVTAVVLLVVAAGWFLLLPPENDIQTGAWPGTLCAFAALVLWWLRGLDRALLIAPAVVASLVALQIAGGSEGWWPGTASAALGALIGLALVRRLWLSVIGAILTITVSVLPALFASEAVQTSPGLTVYRVLLLVLVYVLTLVAAMALRHGAERLDRAELQAMINEERLVRADSDRLAAARVRRVVHDTVLNTLEAIANGVAAQHWGQLNDRCRADLQALDDLGAVSASTRIVGLAESVSHLGLRVDLDDHWRRDPPDLVVEALVGATREALLNAAKHAGTDHVRMRTLVDADAAWIEVADDGQGFLPQPGKGIGLEAAVAQTMRDVGGYALVDSEPGQGTRVTLTWDAARERTAAVLREMRQGMIRFAAGLAAAALLLWALVTTVDTGLAGRDMRLLSLVAAGLVCAALLAGSYRGAPSQPLVVASMAGLGMVTLLLPLGDIYCASFQYGSAIDPRLVILLCLAAGATTWSVYPWAAGVTIGGSVLASMGLMRLSATCGWEYAMSSLVACGIALAAFGFALAVQAQRVRFDAQAQARHQALAVSLQNAARARAQAWASPQLDAARGLLNEVLAGRPDTPGLRDRARDTAQQLRQWLLLMGCTGPVPDALMHAVRTSLHLVIDGDPDAVSGYDLGAMDAARRLQRWLPSGPGDVKVVVSRTGGTASVLLHCESGTGQDDDGWRDEDGSWLHLTWGAGSEAGKGR